ncbi:hypothetical protein SSP35_51_00040 [Streptomyces sp. NBRC 110611]|nr:hypothetical protein SSP35_51_00040 [Streptomyces sp. NBRC 110611]
MATDGFVLDITDTPANDAELGCSGGVKNPAPFPQVKIVGLGECGTHAVVAVSMGPGVWKRVPVLKDSSPTSSQAC